MRSPLVYHLVIALGFFSFSCVTVKAVTWDVIGTNTEAPSPTPSSTPLSVDEILRRTSGGPVPFSNNSSECHPIEVIHPPQSTTRPPDGSLGGIDFKGYSPPQPDSLLDMFKQSASTLGWLLFFYLLGTLPVLFFWQHKSHMKKPQIIVVALGVITIGLITLFPPWKYHTHHGDRIAYQAGCYAFILNPPETYEYAGSDKFHGVNSEDWCSSIDLERYFIELTGSLIFFGGLFFLFRPKKELLLPPLPPSYSDHTSRA